MSPGIISSVGENLHKYNENVKNVREKKLACIQLATQSDVFGSNTRESIKLMAFIWGTL